MLSFTRIRSQQRSNRSMSLGGMDYADPKKKNGFCGKIIMVSALTALCILMLKHPSPSPPNTPSQFTIHEVGVTHVLVTGGAGYIGSHAALRLLQDYYRVTIVDNLSRGNLGAIKVLEQLFPEPGRLQFIYADLGDAKAVHDIFSENAFDAVMHFAAVAYVGESTLDPLKYYHNITSNTLVVLEAMAAHGVKTLIYSSTCATYGEPEKMPITEETPQLPINPYGKAKKMAEDIILDFHKNSDMAVMILRYFNVIGSDPEGRLGEAPRPELREHGRISGACFDAARGIIPGLKVRGTDYKTPDGTCIRDYIDVTDLVDAHVKALEKAKPGHVGIYNVGTGRGRSVKEFVEACKKATGMVIKVDFLPRRPGDYAEVYSNPSKIKNELNWTAQHTNLAMSLQVAWRWQKAHPDGYGAALSGASDGASPLVMPQ
ncbi:UDP-arabinose 4-epimerase 1-like isoform X1 [Andrographis paniculata]|uniref:UDP-arabinose 4-epimerase 1-like isoform X1 n=2 Tax=Andrographis paniculata TaxID=175694 RepID=UPI0021E76A45|nr:UDP-arabinose 4-epimerase 1-like isoform X1 [Andrographis paniculata]XP_051125444.1 UDP-arabinose 4-epimerase 1-like isoform X1 [Andrographis paniculata]XP_051125446.1 UDP-arabinose 4-epimerase 1-like isoform X1 [Andrographis paniculata]